MAGVIIITIITIIVSFYLVIISFMNIFPTWIALPLLLLSILFLVNLLNGRHRFKGFRSRRLF
ncbi:uncharacterized protein (DUF983 family) [Evansella vedderi]|uniref:Uncharacterized protein (DUF983 family) n=1 Tax=Evansella vedderi TaxID=38282 RepID=A0ABT9ZVX6_9BACI|nr:hypothetical protein [Evansella vedderi]MDQ0255391.1 uncharacterized protein (DUF983 family) [Evansella vedderi]